VTRTRATRPAMTPGRVFIPCPPAVSCARAAGE
jgi:hypothetical protein